MLEAGLPVELVPLDVTRQVVLPQAGCSPAACPSARPRRPLRRGLLPARLRRSAAAEDGGIIAPRSAGDGGGARSLAGGLRGPARGDRVRGPAHPRSLAGATAASSRPTASAGPTAASPSTVDAPALPRAVPGPPVPRVVRDRLRQRGLHGRPAAAASPGRDGVGRARCSVNHGGKGANQAVAARRLGAEVRMIGCIGDDGSGARDSRRALAEQGIGVDGLVTSRTRPPVPRSSSWTARGRTRSGWRPGANHRAHRRRWRAGARTPSPGPRCVLCQLEVPLSVVRWALETARRHGVPHHPQPGARAGAPTRCSPRGLPHAERGRGVAAHRHRGAGSTRARQAADRLVERGARHRDRHAGRPRARWSATATAALHFPAFPVDAVDTTGAGDAFNGALASAASPRGSHLGAGPAAGRMRRRRPTPATRRREASLLRIAPGRWTRHFRERRASARESGIAAAAIRREGVDSTGFAEPAFARVPAATAADHGAPPPRGSRRALFCAISSMSTPAPSARTAASSSP